MDSNSGHLSLTDRKLNSCLDYSCENSFPIADRLEKNKTQDGNNLFFSKYILHILELFPSHRQRHHLMFSLPIE